MIRPYYLECAHMLTRHANEMVACAIFLLFSFIGNVKELSGLTKMHSSITKSFPYEVPTCWAEHFTKCCPDTGRLKLGNFPTPIHVIEGSKFQEYSLLRILHQVNITMVIKRDDMSGGPEMGGNKIRKLEFLLADALAKKCDAVVTIGGEQSNHCRATACAARLVGLEPHLILRRTKKTIQVKSAAIVQEEEEDETLGLTGNILYNRIVGSTIHTCTSGEYGRFGSVALIDLVCSSLRGVRNPYPIPVGGSNALGTWGYIEGVNELVTQLSDQQVDHVVLATGSGGTLAGITIGLDLYYRSSSQQRPIVHAVGVCDNPDYFYSKLEEIVEEIGYSSFGKLNIRDWVNIYQGKGKGYALSTTEELEFIQQFAQGTGIALDPVYTGKALYHFIKNVEQNPDKFLNSQVLFWHTGGSVGLHERNGELMTALKQSSPVNRLRVYGK